jgi:predicted  nucleic acid-binding Zn-ribbon protein
MPHQCTDCGRQFDDGSKEMLSGCPNCGGTKFQFLPDGHGSDEPTPQEPPSVEEPESSVAQKVGSAATAVREFVGSSNGNDSPPTPADSTQSAQMTESASAPGGGSEGTATAQTSSRSESAAASPETVTPSTPTQEDRGGTDSLGEPEPASMQTAEAENEAQASARSEVISPEELPPAPEQSGWEATTPGPQADQVPSPDTTERAERPDLSELRAELNEQFESIKVLEPGQYELNLMELFDREEYIIALQEDGKYTVQVPEHWQE